MQKNIRKLNGSIWAIAALLILESCTKQGLVTTGPESLVANRFPPTSKVALIETLKAKDNFQGVQTSELDGQYEVVSTHGDEKFYIKGDRLVSNSRKPTDHERALIYWRGKFKGKAYREKILTDEAIQGHERPLLELACDSLGTGVIYDPSHEEVKRVFYYEAK
jgi:hypothetical protein